MIRNVMMANATAVCIGLALGLIGCDDSGGGGQATGTGSTSAQPSPAGKARPGSLIDVLHLTSQISVRAEATNIGNSATVCIFDCSGLTWDGLNFRADQQEKVEDRPGVTLDRHIKVEGRVTADGKAVERMAVDVQTSKKSGAEVMTNRFTWKGIPVRSETPGDDWQTDPSVGYELRMSRTEVPAHVEGWASIYKEKDVEASTSDQAEMIRLTMAADDATLDASVRFSRK